MLIAYPVLESEGLRSKISPHFGRAPFFLVVETENHTCQGYATDGLRAEGECAPLRALARLGVREVHCPHMGRGALQRCFEYRLQVFQTTASTVEAALTARSAGLCPDLPDEALCGGHDDDDHHC
jgi:predicted Fe-Mo cluster-binding NifX family protein